MEENEQNQYPDLHVEETPVGSDSHTRGSSYSIGIWLSALCVVAAVAVLLTYIFTSRFYREYYSERLTVQQSVIEEMAEQSGAHETDKFRTFAELFQYYSYYAGDVSEEALMDVVLKAYASATGDPYARYYTDEEYAELMATQEGEQVGVGVSVTRHEIAVDGTIYKVFRIDDIDKGSPADASELYVGDFIYRLWDGEEYQTVNALGYDRFLTNLKGEQGSVATFSVFRGNGTQGYDTINLSIVRDAYEFKVVSWALAENDPTVGIVRIERFTMQTPTQLKDAMQALQDRGVEKFVFDLRNNPGGELQSIKAVMTYFLQKGDLILQTVDRNGKTVTAYYAEAKLLQGEYAPCSVSEKEIGMYADLEMTVLCDRLTASAAEVFVATMRDYELATIVGETTYGKGIMQNYIPLSAFGDYTGYIKMTTYAYVTKCGESYHEIGIAPHVEVALNAQAQKYPIHSIPQAEDNQLQAAIAKLS